MLVDLLRGGAREREMELRRNPESRFTFTESRRVLRKLRPFAFTSWIFVRIWMSFSTVFIRTAYKEKFIGRSERV